MIHARIRCDFLDVELSASTGVTTVTGPSGSGKTLLLRYLAGLADPPEGRLLVDDALLFDGAAEVSLSVQERRCVYVGHARDLFPHLTVRENLAFAAASLPRLERRERVESTLDAFQLREHAADLPARLPTAGALRTALARAALSGPRCLLLDEPATGLSPAESSRVGDWVDLFRTAADVPVLWTTRSSEEALAYGECVAIMAGGRILQNGPPAAIMDAPSSEQVAQVVGRHNIFEGEILSMDPASNHSRLRCHFAGREFAIDGPYFRGHLLGARLRLAIAVDEVAVAPLNNGGITLRLNRKFQYAGRSRLEFDGGVVAEIPRRQGDVVQAHGECSLHFPLNALRVIR